MSHKTSEPSDTPAAPDVGGNPPLMRCRTCNAPRAKAPCHKCGGELFAACAGWEEPKLPDIETIRFLAREVGYALGIHGSLERDLDLIAAPWTEAAASPEALAKHIADNIDGRVLAPEQKPLGRWSCNIEIDGWFKLIDLSVAPRVLASSAAETARLREERDQTELALLSERSLSQAFWLQAQAAEAEKEAMRVERDEAVKLLKQAKDWLYNPFEPDNQCMSFKAISAFLMKVNK